MGEEVAESYEGLQSDAQAIKGDEAFAQRTMREAGRSKCRVRVLTEAQVVSGVAGGLGMKPRELMRASAGRVAGTPDRGISGPCDRRHSHFENSEGLQNLIIQKVHG
jgi:hypothetical protein